MHSALFVVRPPAKEETWDAFLEGIKPKLARAKATQRLSENVWLVDAQQDLTALSWLVSFADKLGLPYGLLPFEHEPQWLPVGLDPKTTWDRSES